MFSIIGNGPSYANTVQRFQQRPMRATAPPQPRNARSSPYPENFGQQFNQQTVNRPQRMTVTTLPSPMRVNSPRFVNETSLPSPNYQTVTYTQSSDQFTFESTFAQNNNNSQQNDRTRNNSGMTSEYVRQELRTLVSGRTQQQQQIQQTPQQHNQQLSQMSQSLIQTDLEIFGLLSDSGDDFTQGLLNVSAADVNTNVGVNSPVSHLSLNLNRSNSMVRIILIHQKFLEFFPIREFKYYFYR